jgi:hypothetical protein
MVKHKVYFEAIFEMFLMARKLNLFRRPVKGLFIPQLVLSMRAKIFFQKAEKGKNTLKNYPHETLKNGTRKK